MKINYNSPAYVLIFTAGVSALFTAAIMIVQATAQPAIERNQQLLRQQALVEVFSLGDVAEMSKQQVVDVATSQVDSMTLTDPQTGEQVLVYRAYRADSPHTSENLLAYGVRVNGIGFWGPIEGILAVTTDLRSITGIVFTQHAETPGLGGRITEPTWRQQWKDNRALPPTEQGNIVYIGGQPPVGAADPRQERHVEVITGATGTSMAVGRFVNDSMVRFWRAAQEAGLAERDATD